MRMSVKETDRDIVEELRFLGEWAEANIWEVPIMLPSTLREAANIIEEMLLQKEES